MTLPTNITLPLEASQVLSGDPGQLLFLIRRLVYATSAQMQFANQSANGVNNQYTDIDNPLYPFIQGTTTAGLGTYTTTIITLRRVNLMNFIWFDIKWTAHTGTGNVLVTMPYFAQFVAQNPFSCVIESDGNVFTAGYTYLTGNLTPNTNTIVIEQNGSGQPILALPLAGTGHLRGSITYAGQQGQ